MQNQTELERSLIEFDKHVFEEYILRNNVAPLIEMTLQGFFIVSPGGIEPKQQVIDTIGNLEVESLIVENERVHIYSSTAVLAGKLRGSGLLMGRPFPVLTYLSVYVLEGETWRLSAQSLTPMAAPERA